jgi:hypothetical protein
MLFVQDKFSNYEIFKLLHDQLSATLNIVPYESMSEDRYGIFDSLEIIDGNQICKLILDEPQQLRAQI